MAHEVFVCHASPDRGVAEAMVNHLESHGVRCWMAPRNVLPGADYAQAIVGAISASKAMVLIFSADANESPHVQREVERAVARKVALVPVRIEDVTPGPGFEYYLSTSQWLDAPGPIEPHLDRLTEVVRARLAGALEEAEGSTAGALQELVGRYGPELADDPRRVEALLKDTAGENRAAIAALVAAAYEGVGEQLLQSSQGLTPAVAGRLVNQLQENRALSEEAAQWAVETWADALGVALAAAPAAGMEPTVGAGEDAAAERPAETPPSPPPPATPPPAPPSPQAAPPGPPPEDKRRRRVMAAFLIGAAAVAAAIVGFVVLGGDDEPGVVGASEVFLEPIEDDGPDPFTSNVANRLVDAVRRRVIQPTEPGSDATAVQGIPVTIGSTPGLYGGTRDNSSCDAEQMIEFLSENLDKARAWAETQGIDVDDLASYIRGLTPARLTGDTRVTNHGFSNGRATPRQSVLEAGTAVLVDIFGVPRARCACGNPLLEPVAVQTPAYTGAGWEEFDPANLSVIREAAEALTQLVLIDFLTGEEFGRPVGTSGGSDVGTGDVQVTLRWFSGEDMDLEVRDPEGGIIDFSNLESPSGGVLDQDANYPACNETTSPVENVFWPQGEAPFGDYEVTVHNRGNCTGDAQEFELIVNLGGREAERVTDTLESGGSRTFPFSY